MSSLWYNSEREQRVGNMKRASETPKLPTPDALGPPDALEYGGAAQTLEALRAELDQNAKPVSWIATTEGPKPMRGTEVV